MKKLSTILSIQRNNAIVEGIMTENDLKRYVHDKLKARHDYNEEKADMIAENLSTQYPDNFQEAAKQLENFL